MAKEVALMVIKMVMEADFRMAVVAVHLASTALLQVSLEVAMVAVLEDLVALILLGREEIQAGILVPVTQMVGTEDKPFLKRVSKIVTY